MDELSAFLSFISELRSLPLFPHCYNNQKKVQSSVALIFRINPDFCSLKQNQTIQNNSESPISIEELKNMLDECFQNREKNVFDDLC